MHDTDASICQYVRFGGAESAPNLTLQLTDASTSCIHVPITI